MTTLNDIPIHLLFSQLVPLLSNRDLISLATTCKRFRTYLGSTAEKLWKARLSEFCGINKRDILRYKLLYDKDVPSYNHIVCSTRLRYMCYSCGIRNPDDTAFVDTFCNQCIRKNCLPATTIKSFAKTIKQYFSPELLPKGEWDGAPFQPFYLRSDVDLIRVWISLPDLPLTPQEIWHGLCPMRQQGRQIKREAYRRIVERKQQIFQTQWELAFIYDPDYAEYYLRGPIAPEYQKCVDKAFNSFLPYFHAPNYDLFREMGLIRDSVVEDQW